MIHDALQEENSRSTSDIQASVIAFALRALSRGSYQTTIHVPVQEKNLKIWIDPKSFRSNILAFPLILVQAYAGYT